VNDYNDDGYLDFFSINYSFDWYAGTSLYLGAGNGTTYTEQPQSNFGGYPPPSNATSMVSGKFCYLGNVDIAYVAGSTLTVLCGDGKGNFAPPSNGGTFTYTTPFDASALMAADINADGFEDIVAFGAQPNGTPDAPWSMVVFTNGNDNGFSESAAATSIDSVEGPAGYTFTNTPVAFSTPVMGESLSSLSPLTYPFLTTGTTTTATATLSNVTLPPGENDVVASYLATNSTALVLTGSANGNPNPSLANLATPNGSAKVTNGALELTDGGTWEAGSAFSSQRVDIESFATTFTFQLTNAQADGFTFTLQNNSTYELGGNGGMLGYEGIPHSVALKFDLYNNAGEGNDSTGVYADGADPTVPATDMTSSGVNLHSGDLMRAQLIYDGEYLHVTVTDMATKAMFSQIYAINIPNAIGSTGAYVGFTGATGGLTATQQILSWSFASLPYYPTFYPAYPALVLNGGAAMGAGPNEDSLVMTQSGVTNTAGSAWFQSPVPISQFTNDFTFTGTDAQADGITFTIQNDGPAALGPSGGGLGYGPDAPGGPVGITNSMCIKFDLYNNEGEGNDSTGIYTNGDSPTVPAIDLSSTGVNFHNSDPIHAHIVYDGSTIAMTLIDTVTNATWSHYFYGVNVPSLVGGTTAYVGFTGGTGGLTATEDIDGWTYLPSDTIVSPEPSYTTSKKAAGSPVSEPNESVVTNNTPEVRQ
jgi:hypothetical protein